MNQNKTTYIGDTILKKKSSSEQLTGQFVTIDNEQFYKIEGSDLIRPFFISVVSPYNHWMYFSSNGSLSAGRKNPEGALFPYYTDDKIHDSTELTGGKTIIRVEANDRVYLWEPFGKKYEGLYRCQRNIYKNVIGNKIIFEEVNEDLHLTFSALWTYSEKYGFIRQSKLVSDSDQIIECQILDGVQNLLPYGVALKMQYERSTLIDAYKKNEQIEKIGLGIFSLSSIPVDKAEPSEALIATTVWSTGIPVNKILLSSLQLDEFRSSGRVKEEIEIRAERGAYFIQADCSIKNGQGQTWYIVSDVNQGPKDVADLNNELGRNNDYTSILIQSIGDSTQRLKEIVGAADGLQYINDACLSARHFANVLFNVMRGGTFFNNYSFQKSDFTQFLLSRNKNIYKQYAEWFNTLEESLNYLSFSKKINAQEDNQLSRLFREYLPLTFSRRHGDPSRPWNHYNIDLKNKDGSDKLSYEGNWRDIFQNWEALALSFPGYLESMICKFLNASTADGYNPYRITRDGIDWEVVEPDDPWSYIGYWGDHQLIYLLKLLELSQKFNHDGLLDLFDQKIFSYANVPYVIKSYSEILKDPYDTVLFNNELESAIQGKVNKIGSDAKLLMNKDDVVVHANFIEKILCTLLAKLSNFIPEGGIWLNTQRPEWNDANNALVGNGVSMVTTYYLRRFLKFFIDLFENNKDVEISEEIFDFYQALSEIFNNSLQHLENGFNDKIRRDFMDSAGEAGTKFRNTIYQDGFSGRTKTITTDDLKSFFIDVLKVVDQTIAANERSDKLFHSYNLISAQANDDCAKISYLYEMLEGQVSLLSAHILSPSKILNLLDALKSSTMYREDQESYLLYPDRKLPLFVDKNIIPENLFRSSKFLQKLIERNDGEIVVKDAQGIIHFNGNIRNADVLKQKLKQLDEDNPDPKEIEIIISIYESVFNHKSFTGRSGTFFGYEGLGCIYWHMVSKLILAIQENVDIAVNQEPDKDVLRKLVEQYYDARRGLGFTKSPQVYGAFPFDPYSHTPGNAGAQQPGMTGQVKEDIISRFGELGLRINDGKIRFNPFLLKKDEFVKEQGFFEYLDLNEGLKQIKMPQSTLGFTFCQVPIIYKLSNANNIIVQTENGDQSISILELDRDLSQSIFDRKGEIKLITVELDKESF